MGQEMTDITVTPYNVDQGLSQSTVNRFLQDERGLIWIATGGGLQYFDGRSFRTFDLPESLSSIGFGNILHAIAGERSGNLVVSAGPAILRFNIRDGSFRILERSTNPYLWLLPNSYRNRPLCWLSSGRLCFAGDDRLYPVSLRFTGEMTLPAGFTPLGSAETKEGTLLIAGEKGYAEFKPGKGADPGMSVRWVPLPYPCSYICSGPDDKVYLLCSGFIFERLRDGTLREVARTGIRKGSFLLADRQGNFWIADKNGKRTYRLSDGRLSEIRFNIPDRKLIDEIRPSVTTIFEDRSGNLWFGTDGNGMFYYSPRQMLFGMAGIGFTRSLEYFGGKIWAGTFQNGLWRLSTDLKEVLRADGGKTGNDLYYLDLATTGKDRLWAATNKGILIYDTGGRVVFRFPVPTISAKFLRLPGGHLLLSTYQDLYACETGPHPRIYKIREQTQIREFVSSHGFYWSGSQFGLFRKDTAAGVLAAMQFGEKDRLSAVPVYCILPTDTAVWTGTEHGLACYSFSGEKKKFTGDLREMNPEIIYSLIRDSRGRIWFAGNKGAGCILPGQNKVLRFTSRHNLQSSEFNYNADLMVPGGEIFFGGINGVNVIHPERLVTVNSSPVVSLVALSISDSSYVQGIPPEGAGIRIHWRSPSFSGSVFSPDYLPPGTAEYSFLLEGYQDQWSKPVADPGFSFRNLPPGEYTLRARCSDASREPGKAVLLATFVIRPPFWKTPLFLTLGGLFLVGLLLLVMRKIQENRHRAQIRALEQRNAIDRERLRISQDMHDEIGASLTQISILSEIIKQQKGSREENMKLIEQISGISGDVVDEMSDIIWAMNPKNDNLASFASYLRHHASEYLSVAGIGSRFLFPEDVPPVPMTSEQRRNIFLVVKEALHNILKHSQAQHAVVSLGWNGSLLEISVEDDGRGFPAESSGNLGNGLTNMRRRTEELGGTFLLESDPGKGTRLRISVILPENKTA
jgi:signal transduction histidine kinase